MNTIKSIFQDNNYVMYNAEIEAYLRFPLDMPVFNTLAIPKEKNNFQLL